MKSFRIVFLLIGMLARVSFLPAESISGTVRNGTHNTPVAGDQVLLLRFSQGLEEVSRTTTDRSGQYRFDVVPSGPHLVRVLHQGQVYDREPHPGAKAINVEVYDTGAEVKPIFTPVVIVGLQAAKDALEVIEMHVVENSSNPPRTSDSKDGFQVELPAGAELEWVRGLAPGGQPASVSAARLTQSDSYGLHFPLRPGETRLEVAYRLKYAGNANVVLQFPTDVARLAIVVPDGFHFVPVKGTQLQRASEKGAEVELIAGVTAGRRVAFRVTGSGPVVSQPFAAKTVQTEAAPTVHPATGTIGGNRNVGVERMMQPPSPNSRRNAYILAGLLVALACGILLVRIVLPRFSPYWRMLGTNL